MKKFLSTILIFVILSLVFPFQVFATAKVSNLPLRINLTDTKGQNTSPVVTRVSDALVVNSDNLMVRKRGSSTNLVTYSEDLTDASWVETGSGTVNSATLFTFAAQNDVLDVDIICSLIRWLNLQQREAIFLLTEKKSLKVLSHTLDGSGLPLKK